ncbi:septum formation protein Maf [Mesobaculum littorinae]|uniref:Nucleoside triphosphate pyrophosphatase n=1 Tax=Mesobaculum littorinae TaxID=2486419 RepID=A0A438AHC3_9RHOB|nr:Maf family nucleotide pyrophosphatase [Mesobaculum littorinae]RVV98015.1 septum formation protein Maf [Mesobaculum littorinae]
MPDLILASGSAIRQQLLRSAGLEIAVEPARIDEDALRAGLEAEGAPPRDVADTLAEAKARKIGQRHADTPVLGCDQVLAHDGRILGKPPTADDAAAQLRALSGHRHSLLSAAVLYEGGKPVWRHVGVVRMQMRTLSEGYIAEYVARNWPGIGDSVGGYKLEEEGARLFSRVEGDYFTVLGLPLLDLLSFLTARGSLKI